MKPENKGKTMYAPLKSLMLALLVTFLAVPSSGHGETLSALELEMAGFKILEETSEFVSLKFNDESPVTISKSRFSSSEDASRFCSKLGLKLQESSVVDTILLFAMSGATESSGFLKKAITFRFEKDGKTLASGVWAWAGNSEKVVAIFDRQGMGTEVIPLSEISQIGQKFGLTDLDKLPSICE